MNRPKENKRLPPGQTEIPAILRWGKEHPSITPSIPRISSSTWSLTIDGEVERPLKLSYAQLLGYPATESVIDFHCVEGWSVLGCKWEGAAFKVLADAVKPMQRGRFVLFGCADGYSTSLPLEELVRGNALLAYKLNGEELPDDLGGPVRLIVADKYAYKDAMWVNRITFTARKELGYWEMRGYSDTADPWKEDRLAI